MLTNTSPTLMEQFDNMVKEAMETEIPEKYRSLPTTSAKIRAMHADGYSRSKIKELLKLRYQHVRNVLVKELKKSAAK